MNPMDMMAPSMKRAAKLLCEAIADGNKDRERKVMPAVEAALEIVKAAAVKEATAIFDLQNKCTCV